MRTRFISLDAPRRAKCRGSDKQHPWPPGGLRGGELEVMLAQALEEHPHCLDVNRRVGVADDHIVEVGCHLFQALYNLVQNPDDTPARSAAALWHDEPLTEARVSVKRRERSGILVRGILMK